MLSWDIAQRFRASKHHNRFIGFISASSTLGIALGCAALILLLSVMNGFERELKDRLLSLIPHGELEAATTSGLADSQPLLQQLSQRRDIAHAHGVVKAAGLVQKGKVMSAVQLTGIDPGTADGYATRQFVSQPQWHGFSADKDGLVLGLALAQKLGVAVGDRVQVLLPQTSDSGRLRAPITHWFTLRGTLNMGGQAASLVALANIDTLATLLDVKTGVQAIQLRFVDPFSAPALTREIGYGLDQQIYMSDWTRTHGHLYQDIQLVRGVVYLVLTLVIAVACFNIVSTLVMAVKEKQGEIAILKTMGAESGLVMGVFVWQGLVNGFIGSALGCGVGSLIAFNLSRWIAAFESMAGVKVLSGDIYFIDFLPTQLNPVEVLITATVAITLSFVSTLYPAWQAARVEPARVL